MSTNSNNDNYGRIDEVALSQVPALEDCYVTLDPLEFKVIIAPAEAPKVSKGGIVFSQQTTETLGDRYQVGRLIAKAPLAFSAITIDGMEPPEGALVRYAKYAGGEHIDIDERAYRIMMDKDIIGVYNEEKIAAYKNSEVYKKKQAEKAEAEIAAQIARAKIMAPQSSLILAGGSN